MDVTNFSILIHKPYELQYSVQVKKSEHFRKVVIFHSASCKVSLQFMQCKSKVEKGKNSRITLSNFLKNLSYMSNKNVTYQERRSLILLHK